jgi:hypothetical protein
MRAKVPKSNTVKALIEELQKLPQEARVFAIVTSLTREDGEVRVKHMPKPAHAHLHAGGDVHVLGRIADIEEE